MIGTSINTIALLVGTSIGCLLKKGLNKGFEAVLFIAMGLAALGIGWENVTNNMPKSHYPVLFIVSLALGGIAGTALDIAGHFDRLVDRVGKSNRASHRNFTVLYRRFIDRWTRYGGSQR